MQLKRRSNQDFSHEQELVIWSITNTDFLKDILRIYEPELLQSTSNKRLMEWSVEYFERYGMAPQKMIWDIFDTKKTDLSDSVVDKIEKVLENLDLLSGKLNNNREYFFGKSHDYLRKRSLINYSNTIRELAEENLELAESKTSDYKRIEKETGKGIDVYSDTSALVDAFREDNELATFRFPGILGEAIGDMLRGDVNAFLAPQKRGKTWMLLYTAYIASSAGLKVLFWSKEMKEKIVLRRYYQMLAGETKSEKKQVQIPYFENKNIRYKSKDKEGTKTKEMLRIQKATKKRIRGGQLKIVDMKSCGKSYSDLLAVLDNLEYQESFVPDVIIDDYATITCVTGEKGVHKDFRHQIDWRWQKAKEIAQIRNLCYITASQAAKAAHNRDMTNEDVAEDIRVLSTVGQLIMLNQTKEEKKQGIMRIDVTGRHDEYTVDDEVLILQSLSVGRPVIGSEWLSQVGNYTKKKENEK
ncbi:MAG: hypothetical protein GY679_01200 [Mycoplasma sp.]|nr:hypothetical protein [Mycoplasma sp.]